MPERKTIAISTTEYEQLRRVKDAFELSRNRKYDWGEFLAMLALGAAIAVGLMAAPAAVKGN